MTGPVTLSHSELRSLITKAARGAGLGWGLAEEAGWAAEWLARRGLPAADWAALWLVPRHEGQLSPVEVGVRLADDPPGDAGPTACALPDGLQGPGYLLPFLARLAEVQGAVAVTSAQGLVVRVEPDGQVTFGPSWLGQSRGWTCGMADDPALAAPTAPRPTVAQATLDQLDALALRTTVPQSDRSRRDAGARTGDND